MIDNNPFIPLSECTETLARAKQIVDDKRIPPSDSFLSGYRDTIRRMILSSGPKGYLTQKQVNYLDGMYQTYQKLIEFNNSLEENVRQSLADLLKEAVDLAKPFASKNNSVNGSRSYTLSKARQVREGQYIYDDHAESAVRLLKRLGKLGVDVANLEEKASELQQKTNFFRNSKQ